MPLFPRDGQHGSNFLSKRIMLTFTLDIYPLCMFVVLFLLTFVYMVWCMLVVHLEEAIALGVTCDTTVAHASQLLPFCSLERTVSKLVVEFRLVVIACCLVKAQIFLYHILKQLLRRK